MIEKTFKIISWCRIPEKITNGHWISSFQNGCYVPFICTPAKEQENYDDDFSLDNWIISEYPELERQQILIDINY